MWYELRRVDEEYERDMESKGLGLVYFESARARAGEFSDAKFWVIVKEHLDDIRELAADLRTELRLKGWPQIMAHRRERLSSLKFSLLLWMFRHDVRRLDPSELRRVESDEVRERLARVEKLIASNVATAASAAAALESGTYRSGRNKGKPLTEVRAYSVRQEQKRDLEIAANCRRERLDLLHRLAQLESKGTRVRLA